MPLIFLFLTDVLFFSLLSAFHNPVIGNLMQRVDFKDFGRAGRADADL